MPMPYNLFLDDFREPEDAFMWLKLPVYLSEEWIIVRSYEEFVKVVEERGVPDIVSFDHDLADEHYDSQQPYEEYQEKTGYHCAKWLINYCIDHKKEVPETILIHSMNVTGTQNIVSLFNSYLKSQSLDSPSARN